MSRFTRPLDAGGRVRARTATEVGDEPPPGRSGSRTARLAGAVGLIGLTVLLFWLLTDDGFRVTATDVEVKGVELADPAAVLDYVGGIDREPNVFRLQAREIVEDLGALPEVAFARASVTLPAGVTVEVVERVPIFIWSDGDSAWLVDAEGVLFSTRDATIPASTDVAEAAEADSAFGHLPTLEDARLVKAPFAAGDRLPAIDVAVMRQLLGITPAFVGSDAPAIRLRIDDVDGYVLEGEGAAWQAVFGHFRANVQPPTIVPLQAQCLAALFATRPEHRILRVALGPAEQRCGTFTTVRKRDQGA